MPDMSADSIRWVPEHRAAQLAGTPRSTVQGWDRERFLERPESGIFQEHHIFELLLAGTFREELTLADAKSLWRNMRRTGAIAVFLDLAKGVSSERDQLDLVMDIEMGDVTFACDEGALLTAVRGMDRSRRVFVAPLGHRVWRARQGFENFASTEQAPTVRRGRPPKRAASVHAMKPDQ
jgi:hypothetical protein